MWGSADTTTNTIGQTSQLSFYEYPPHKPFINSINQPLRPSHSISTKVALPESNRDQLLTALQSLSLKIRTLENERERAEFNLRDIKNHIHRSRPRHEDSQDSHDKIIDVLNEHKSRKSHRSGRKRKCSSQQNHSFETTTTTSNSEGRHFHLDMNTVPFILGASTSPSHNVTSNVQNVMALLKNHNHQLCLSSKEYSERLHPNLKGDLSPHTILYLDHYHKSPSTRPSSASPVRSNRRPTTASVRRPYSASHRSQIGNFSDKQCYARMKNLRQEFSVLAREHARLNGSQTNLRELEIINRRMEIILDELERLQRQIKISIRKSLSKDQLKSEKPETPLETLRKTRLLQLLLKDSTNQQQYRRHSRRTRPNSYD